MSEASLEDSAQEDSASESAAPRVDITASASPSGHYDPQNDVILSVEAMGAKQTRVRRSFFLCCEGLFSPSCWGHMSPPDASSCMQALQYIPVPWPLQEDGRVAAV